MSKSSEKTGNFLTTAGGVILVLVLFVALNVIAGGVRLRADLTENNLNTLSPGTRAILKKLDTPVTIRFYLSQSENALPVDLRPFTTRVADLLEEIRNASGGKIEGQRLDPKPDTDAEDSATLDGIEPRMNESGQPVYMGLAFTCVDQRVAIPFLNPARERQLEYDIARSISQVTSTKKAVVGVMTTLPMFGTSMDMNMMMMGQRGRPPWIIIEELQRLFDVRDLGMDVKEIPADVQVLIVAHPAGITESAQFAIDQFILRGGKLVAFLDPLSFTQSAQNRMPQMAPPQGSSLPKLLEAWGLTFDETMVVADATHRTLIDRGSGREDMLAVLSLTSDAVNSDDVVTGEIESLLLPMPGAFDGNPSEGLRKDILLSSSKEAQLVETFRAQAGGNDLIESFRPSGDSYALAVRLTGKFKTAFPDGPPAAAKPEGEDNTAEGADQQKEEKPKDDAAAAEKKPESLKESTVETSILLFADSDLLYDEFSVRVGNLLGQEIRMQMNENLTLVMNAVEQMTGDANLISIRSRGDANRPFTVIRDLENAAEEKFRSRVAEFTAELSEVRSKLSDIESSRKPGQNIILSPEMQADLLGLRKKEAELDKTVRELRRQLRRDVETLQTSIKWLNILGMPALVVGLGVTVVAVRRRRQAAK
jgi:ABC-type uncharacterized transport system involved in gliding motility auxiliary subunit